jgi:hypothetical protein
LRSCKKVLECVVRGRGLPFTGLKFHPKFQELDVLVPPLSPSPGQVKAYRNALWKESNGTFVVHMISPNFLNSTAVASWMESSMAVNASQQASLALVSRLPSQTALHCYATLVPLISREKTVEQQWIAVCEQVKPGRPSCHTLYALNSQIFISLPPSSVSNPGNSSASTRELLLHLSACCSACRP